MKNVHEEGVKLLSNYSTIYTSQDTILKRLAMIGNNQK